MDILEALKEAGYSAYRLRKEKIFGERVVQQLRQGELVSWATIGKVCTLLDCQPGDLLEHVLTGGHRREGNRVMELTMENLRTLSSAAGKSS